MMRKMLVYAVCVALLLVGLPAGAQVEDGLSLDLYVLSNAGVVQVFGAAGVRTVTPESDFVLDFGVAPDNRWLAYRTETGMHLLDMYEPGSQMTIEEVTANLPPLRGRGDTMVWSPAGDVLAYTTQYGARFFYNSRNMNTYSDVLEGQFYHLSWSPDGRYLAAGAEGGIWWLYRREGSTMTLTSAIPSSDGLAWVSGSEVVFAPGDGGLFLMDLANANAQTPLLDNTWVYRLPAQMESGMLALFGREIADTTLEANAGRWLAFDRANRRIDSISETAIDTSGLAWVPGGELAILFRGGVLALVTPATGQGLPLPISDVVAYSWGAPPLEAVPGIGLPVDGYFLAQDGEGVVQVWRLPADGSLAAPIMGVSVDVTAYGVSNDGRNVAYVSDGRLWLSAAGGTAEEAVELADTGRFQVRDVVFSPDGGRIAYSGNGGVQFPEGGIWMVSATGGDAALILRDGPGGDVYAPPFYRDPAFAPNVDALLVTEGGAESTAFVLLDPNSGEVLSVGSFNDVFWLSDGRVAAYGNGVGIGDPPPAEDIFAGSTDALLPISAVAAPLTIRTGTQRNASTLRLAASPNVLGPSLLQVLDVPLAGGEPSLVTSGGFMSGVALSPDGGFLAGQTHNGGALTFRNLDSGRQVILSEPAVAWNFRWGS